MKYANHLRAAALMAALGAGSVLAQTPARVMTDVAPPPAEDRSSPGAIVLENSMVQAQRENAFERSAARNGVASIGRGVVRATMREKTKADLAQARVDEAVQLHSRGAGSLTEK